MVIGVVQQHDKGGGNEVYNFIWATATGSAPIVTFAPYGITFNGMAIEMMKRPWGIMIGYDDNKKVVGIKPVYDEESDAKGKNSMKIYGFIEKERHGYVRIGNKDLIRYLSNRIGIDYSVPVKYALDWKENDQIAIIELDKPIQDFKSEKSEVREADEDQD